MSTSLLLRKELSQSSNPVNLSNFKILFPTLLGTVVEYYDYALYGFCASLLAAQFFSVQEPTTALIKTFGIFVAGSLSKPLGAILFGHIGDHFGRSISLKISMIGIALPTVIIGLLPTYAVIGWWAPLLLLLCRILQGMLTAGESEGARIFIYESIGKHRPCLTNSLSGIASMLGIYLASLAASACIALETRDAWRLPFLVGGILGIGVFWIRSFLPETPEFIQFSRTKLHSTSSSFQEVLLKNKKFIFAAILLCGASGGGYHLYLVFLGHYLSTLLHLTDPSTAAFHTSQAILIYTLTAPLAGLIADRFGAFKVLKWALWSLLGVGFLNIFMIQQLNIPFWLIGLTAGILAFSQTPGNIVLLRAFSTGERYRCMSIGHAMGSMIFSGSATVIGLWLWQITGWVAAPLIYFVLLTLFKFIAVMLFQQKA